jgi:perosamine synthetase
MIRLGDPCLGDEELALVERALRSGFLIQGAMVARFEELVAARSARKHAIAVTNGTAALELSLRALGVGPGDDVLVPNVSWPSPAHAVAWLGARPILVDVDAQEWNARPDAYLRARTPQTKAAIAIDQFGSPARVAEIAAALGDLPILEDAACAIGSERPTGARSVMETYSFHPRKVVATGEGGMIATDDDALAQRLRIMRNHGQTKPGEFALPGPNVRLSEIAAAIGVAQMEKLDAMLVRRRELAARYREALPELSFQREIEGARSNWQTMGALVPARFDANGRDAFLERVRAQGVEVGKLSYALHRIGSLTASAEEARSRGETFAASSAIVDRGFALPLHLSLSDEDQTRVVDAVRAALVQ